MPKNKPFLIPPKKTKDEKFLIFPCPKNLFYYKEVVPWTLKVIYRTIDANKSFLFVTQKITLVFTTLIMYKK